MISNNVAFSVSHDASHLGVNLMTGGEVNNDTNESFAGIVGESSGLRSVLQLVEMVAATSTTVLLLGETGTGKELIAHALHNASHRCGRAFIKLSCADSIECYLVRQRKIIRSGSCKVETRIAKARRAVIQ